MSPRPIAAALLVSSVMLGSVRPVHAEPAVGLSVGFSRPSGGAAWGDKSTTLAAAAQLSVPLAARSSADTLLVLGRIPEQGGYEDAHGNAPHRFRLLEAVTLGTPFTDTTVVALRLGIGLDAFEYRYEGHWDFSPLLHAGVVLTKPGHRIDLVGSLGLDLAGHHDQFDGSRITTLDLELLLGALVKL